MAVQGLKGGAQAALTTSEAVVDLSLFAGRTVRLWSVDGDFWFSFSDSGAAGQTLVTAGAQAASASALVAERVAQGWKEPILIDPATPYLVVKLVTGTGTLKVKPVSKKNAGPATVPGSLASGTPVAVSGTLTAAQGTAAAVGAAWPVKITDGTNTSTVKAASTAPVAADPAQVVTISPNRPPWSYAKNLALAASLIVKNSAGKLRSFSCRLDKTAPSGTYYVQLADASALPADATVPFDAWEITHTNGAADILNVSFGDDGIDLTNGIVICLSSTEATKTIAGAYLRVNGAEYR